MVPTDLPNDIDEKDVHFVRCLCDGRVRFDGEDCARCEWVYARVRSVLRSHDTWGSNPVWSLAGALARVVGAGNIDWEVIRRLAVAFEDPAETN